MKTFATALPALLAGGLGVFGTFGAAEAALPYGYGTSGSASIAAGGCYAPAAHGRYDTGYDDFADHPTSYGRPASGRSASGRSASGRSTPSRPFHNDRFDTLPYSTGRGASSGAIGPAADHVRNLLAALGGDLTRRRLSLQRLERRTHHVVGVGRAH